MKLIYKFFLNSCTAQSSFFIERVNIKNSLPVDTAFSSLTGFTRQKNGFSRVQKY